MPLFSRYRGSVLLRKKSNVFVPVILEDCFRYSHPHAALDYHLHILQKLGIRLIVINCRDRDLFTDVYVLGAGDYRQKSATETY